MRHNFRLFAVAGVLVAGVVGLIVSSCGGSDSGPHTYVASSTKGDLATWTIDGDNFSVIWKVTDTSGAIKRTLTITGTCAAADANFKHRACTVGTASCADGNTACVPSDSPTAGQVFNLLEVPGTAMMVRTPSDSELHVGVIAGDCAAVAGDYSFVKTGLGETGIFGMYRLGSAFDSVTHADFKFTNVTTLPVGTEYSDPNGVVAITGATCDGGVWTGTVNGSTIRFTNTASGIFLIDLPSGSGGIVSIRTAAAASIGDLAGKTFYGVTFPDNGSPELLNATTGASTGSFVPLTSVNILSGGIPTAQTVPAEQGFYSLTDFSGQTPSGPNFNVAPTGPGDNYTTNALAATYPTTKDIPGLYWMKTQDPAPPKGLMVVAMKDANGKILLFGVVANDVGGSTIGIKGNFLVFEQ